VGTLNEKYHTTANAKSPIIANTTSWVCEKSVKKLGVGESCKKWYLDPYWSMKFLSAHWLRSYANRRKRDELSNSGQMGIERSVRYR